jgi:large repetitive protein
MGPRTLSGAGVRRRVQAGTISALLLLGLAGAAQPVLACDPPEACPAAWLASDIRPGSQGSLPADMMATGSAYARVLYFSATDGTSGRELWKSPGHGATRVKDINPGSASSNPRGMTAVGKKVFFSASDGASGRELWVTNGTAAGTRRVKDIWPGAAGSNPEQLTAVGKILFFTADDGTRGRELWKSDGTAAGTVLVRNINGPWRGVDDGSFYPEFPGELTAFGGRLFFAPLEIFKSRWEIVEQAQLWVSDGTAAGTQPFYGWYPDQQEFDSIGGPTELTKAGSLLFLRDGWGRLWRSNGTESGTRPLHQADPIGLTNVRGTLYFQGTGGLWKSKGTKATTNRVRAFPSTEQIGQITSYDGFAAFTVNEDIWISDGTAAGTVRVVDAPAGAAVGNLTWVSWALFYTLNGKLHYLSADRWCHDNPADCDYSWYADGGEWAPELGLRNVSNLFTLDNSAVGTLMMSAGDGVHGRELWGATTGD